MFSTRIVALVLSCLSFCPAAIAIERIDIVVIPDYSTKLAGELSDRLYKLIDNNSQFALVAYSSGLHLEFEVSDVAKVNHHEPVLVSLNVSSTLYKKKYRGVDNEAVLIDRSTAMCNERLFKVCENGMQARLEHALKIALQSTAG